MGPSILAGMQWRRGKYLPPVGRHAAGYWLEKGAAMLRYLVRALSLVAVCALLVAPAAAYTLVSEEGRFSAEFPAEPTFEKINTKLDAGYTVDRHRWLLDRGSVAWIVSYVDYRAENVQRLGAETMYDNASAGAVESLKGTLLESLSIDHSGIRGREIFVLVPNGNLSLRQRFFISANRLYQNIYVGPRATERDTPVEAFLKSFQIFK